MNPWGEDRADLRAGIIASTVANSMSTGRTYEAKHFMPFYDHENDYQSLDEMKAVFEQVETAWNKGKGKQSGS